MDTTWEPGRIEKSYTDATPPRWADEPARVEEPSTASPSQGWVAAGLSLVPVAAFTVAAGIAEALDGEPAPVVETMELSAFAALFFVALPAALALALAGSGRRRVPVLVALSVLAAAMGAYIAASRLYDAGQAILFYPVLAILAAAAAAALAEVQSGRLSAKAAGDPNTH